MWFINYHSTCNSENVFVNFHKCFVNFNEFSRKFIWKFAEIFFRQQNSLRSDRKLHTRWCLELPSNSCESLVKIFLSLTLKIKLWNANLHLKYLYDQWPFNATLWIAISLISCWTKHLSLLANVCFRNTFGFSITVISTFQSYSSSISIQLWKSVENYSSYSASKSSGRFPYLPILSM